MTQKWWHYIFSAFVLLVFSGFMVVSSFLQCKQGQESLAYQSTQAVILSSKTHFMSNGYVRRRPLWDIRPTRSDVVHYLRGQILPRQNYLCLTYAYKDVQGQQHTSDRYKAGKQCMGEEFESSALGRLSMTIYRKGESIVIYYNPQNPEEAVIETGIQTWSVLNFCIYLFVFFLGLISLVYGFFLKLEAKTTDRRS
jgi:hypothetical protein